MRPAPLWPVSVKAVVLLGDSVVLVHNERNEWELPGGRLEVGESPAQCVVREVAEETGLDVEARRLVDAWMYPVLPSRTVLVLTYGCVVVEPPAILTVSDEHDAVEAVSIHELSRLHLPVGYRASIEGWLHHAGRRSSS